MSFWHANYPTKVCVQEAVQAEPRNQETDQYSVIAFYRSTECVGYTFGQIPEH